MEIVIPGLAVLGILFLSVRSFKQNRVAEDRAHACLIEAEEVYQQCVRSCSPQIDSMEHYGRARSAVNVLSEDSQFLNAGEHRYLTELTRACGEYARNHPWVRLTKVDVVERTEQIRHIEMLCRRGVDMVSAHGLKYVDAQEQMQRAGEVAASARLLIGGMLPGACNSVEQAEYERQLRELPTTLDKAIVSGNDAIASYHAEMRGQIRYQCSVRKLLASAAGADDIDTCVTLVRQAVEQSENPDKSAAPHDLAMSLQALALITWRNLKQPLEAEALYMRVLANTTVKLFLCQTFHDLAWLCVEQGRFKDAASFFASEADLAERLKLGNSFRIRGLLRLARAYQDAREFENGLKCARAAVALTQGPEGVEYCEEALGRVTMLLCYLSLFEDAIRLYDEYKSRQMSGFDFDSEENLLILAGMFLANKREREAMQCLQSAFSNTTKERDAAAKVAEAEEDARNVFSLRWKLRALYSHLLPEEAR